MNGSSGIEQLKVPAGMADPAVPEGGARTPEQLRLLAAQFESMLLSQMLTQMRSSMFDDEDGDSGFAKGPLADAMYTELSQALSRAGGFGLGESIMAPLMKQAGSTGMTDASGLEMPTFDITMPAAVAPISREALFEGRLSSSFGWREHPVTGGMKFHKGVDIAMPVGREVQSARGGEVTFAGEQGAYGLTVIVDHGGGASTRYAHLSELRVKTGDVVGDGQLLGLSGRTGRVTGAHLHFEVLENGQPVDPASGVRRLYARG